MNILAIIPARGGSKGIPMKNIKYLYGKPLLYYSIKAAQKSNIINRIVVSTDNPKIAKYANVMGVEVIKRPKKLSTDKAKIEPVISHTIEFLKDSDNYIPDIIVLLQNTSPLRTSKHVDESIQIFFKKKYDSLLSVSPSHYFIWIKNNQSAIPLNYNPRKRPNRQDMKNEFFENGAIYITKYSEFKKTSCRISGNIGLYVMKPEDSYQVDSSDEFYFIEQLIKKSKKS